MSHRFLHFSAEIKLLLFPPQPLQVNLNIQDTEVVFHLRCIVYKIQRSSFIYTAIFTRHSGRLLYTRHYLQDTEVVFHITAFFTRYKVFFHIHGNIYKIQRSYFIFTALSTQYRSSLLYTRHCLQDTEVVFHITVLFTRYRGLLSYHGII